MLAIFCLRLACGLIGSLLLFSPSLVNPRFYRAHFLIGLGVTGVAVVFAWNAAGFWLMAALSAALLLAFLGSVVWSLEGAPGGCWIIGATVVLLVSALCLLECASPAIPANENTTVAVAGRGWHVLGGLSSAALLGTATTGMLMGHSYLNAPTMSLQPLFRLLS